MIKTLDYQFCKAISIADSEEGVVVGFFCNLREFKMLRSEYDFTQGAFFQAANKYVAPNGSVVQFLDIGFAPKNYSGSQFTHAFVNGRVDYKMSAFIRSRVRTTKNFVEPSGYYDEVCVTRIEDY